MNLGDKIAELRRLKGYTQEKLAEILNVSRQSVYKWESNISLPELDKIQALAKLFETTIDGLLNKDNELKEDKATIAFIDKPRMPKINNTETLNTDSMRDHMIYSCGMDVYEAARKLNSSNPVYIFFSVLIIIVDLIAFISFVATEPQSLVQRLSFAFLLVFLTVLFISLRIVKRKKAQDILLQGNELLQKKRKEIITKFTSQGYQLIETLPVVCYFFFINKQNKTFGTIIYDKIAFECPFESFLKCEVEAAGGRGYSMTKSIVNAGIGGLIAGAPGAIMGALIGVPNGANSPHIYRLGIITKEIGSRPYSIILPSYFSSLANKDFKMNFEINQLRNRAVVIEILKLLSQIQSSVI